MRPLLTSLVFLAACSTIRPYHGDSPTVDTSERFVRWTVVGKVMEKRVELFNPYGYGVRVELSCREKPVLVPPHSVLGFSIEDDEAGVRRDACFIRSWDKK